MLKKTLTTIIVFALSWLLCNVSVAQNIHSLNIVVLDSNNLLPLEAVSITLPQYHYYKQSNEKGEVKIDSLLGGWTTIQCSFVGYNPYTTSIYLDKKNTSLKILLCPLHTHLHEVEIFAHTDETEGLSIQNKNKIDPLWIERNIGNTITDLLKILPGVSVLSSGPNISKPIIRGMYGARLVVLNNNIKQEGQQWGEEHGLEIDPFSGTAIEVIKGAAAIEYGANSIGGVIKYQPKPFKTSKGINGMVLMNGATNNGLASGSLFVEGKSGNKHQLSWRTQATYRKAGDARAADYVLSNTAFTDYGINYAIHYQYKNFHFEGSQSIWRSSLGILRAAHIGNIDDLYAAIKNKQPAYIAPFGYKIENPKQELAHVVSGVKMYYELLNGSRIVIQYSFQDNNREEYDRPPQWSSSVNNQRALYDLHLTTSLAELKFEHAKWRNTKGVWGLSWMNQGNVSSGILPLIPNYRLYNSGIYAIEKWQHKKISAEAGIRYDWLNQTAYTRTNNSIISKPNAYAYVSFSSGIAYWINESLKIQGNIASSWRAPNMNELYSNGLHSGIGAYETGNENLKTESSINKEITFSVIKNTWQSDFSIFRNDMKQYIYKEPLAQPVVTIRGTFPNFVYKQNDAVFSGVEYSGKINWSKSWNLSAQAGLLYAINADNNLPLIFIPANRISLMLTYQKEEFWKLNDVYIQFAPTFVAHQRRYPSDIDFIPPPPAYNLYALHFGFDTHFKKQHIHWNFSIQNLLNTSYRDYLSRFRYFADDTGINFILRISVPFSIYQTKQ